MAKRSSTKPLTVAETKCEGPAVLMLSGGLDSVVLAHHAMKANVQIASAVFLDYGQEAADRELHASRRTALRLGIPFEPVNISGLKYLFYGVLPSVWHPMMAECKCNDRVAADGIVATYAVLRGVPNVFAGVIRNDIDQTPGEVAYLKHFAAAISSLHATQFQIHTPFIDLAKPDVVRLGVKLGVDFSETWCCYGSGPLPCGECNGCRKRRQAFRSASVRDTAYTRNALALG